MTLFDNPHLQARDFFPTVQHPEAGTHPYAGIPWKLSRTPGRVRMPAPCLGQHNEEVLQGRLGLSPEAFAALEARGVTGRTPPRREES